MNKSFSKWSLALNVINRKNKIIKNKILTFGLFN